MTYFLYFIEVTFSICLVEKLENNTNIRRTFEQRELRDEYFGIFSNLACLSASVPHGTFKNQSFSNTPSAICPPLHALTLHLLVFCPYIHKNAMLREK